MVFQFPGTQRQQPRQRGPFTDAEIRARLQGMFTEPELRTLLTLKERRPEALHVLKQFMEGLRIQEEETAGA